MCSTGLHTPDVDLENMKEMREVWLAIGRPYFTPTHIPEDHQNYNPA